MNKLFRSFQHHQWHLTSEICVPVSLDWRQNCQQDTCQCILYFNYKRGFWRLLYRPTHVRKYSILAGISSVLDIAKLIFFKFPDVGEDKTSEMFLYFIWKLRISIIWTLFFVSLVFSWHSYCYFLSLDQKSEQYEWDMCHLILKYQTDYS